MNYQDRINNFIPKLPHKLQVNFALYCAKDVFQYVKDKDKKSIKQCLDLVEAWLEGKDVTPEELQAAAFSAYYTYSPAASYAASAAFTSVSSYTAASVVSAISSIYYASYSVPLPFSKEEKYKEYYEYLITLLTDLEKILYNTENL